MYESGNEDKIDDVIEKNNIEIKKREDETERKRLDTIHQMELNRESAKQKEIDEQKKREYLTQLSEALGITQHREEIDKLNQSVTYLADRMSEDRTSINEILQIVKGNQVRNEPLQNQTDNVNKFSALTEALPQLLEVWKVIKGNDAPHEEPLISQATIREKMVQTFNDNLETGEAINNFIKNSLKKTVTRKIVEGALSEIGKESVEHGPL